MKNFYKTKNGKIGIVIAIVLIIAIAIVIGVVVGLSSKTSTAAKKIENNTGTYIITGQKWSLGEYPESPGTNSAGCFKLDLTKTKINNHPIISVSVGSWINFDGIEENPSGNIPLKNFGKIPLAKTFIITIPALGALSLTLSQGNDGKYDNLWLFQPNKTITGGTLTPWGDEHLVVTYKL